MLSSVRELADGARRLQELSKKISEVHLREELIAQRELLLDARDMITGLREEKANLEAEVVALRDLHAREAVLVEDRGFMFEANEDGTPRGDPFCSVCLEKHDGHFRLTTTQTPGRPMLCPNCSAVFTQAPRHNY